MGETTRQALRDAGVEPERMALEWTSAAEAPRFVELITGFVATIRSLGPLGSAEGEPGREEVQRHLDAAVKAFEVTRVRTPYGTLARNFRKAGDYSSETITEGVSQKVFPGYRQERLSQEVQAWIGKAGPSDVATLCEKTRGSQEEIDTVLAALAKKGHVKADGALWAAA
jgi:hypothetical protein